MFKKITNSLLALLVVFSGAPLMQRASADSSFQFSETSGSFPVDYSTSGLNSVVDIGGGATIPVGVNGLVVSISSNSDIDVRLYDVTNGVTVIGYDDTGTAVGVSPNDATARSGGATILNGYLGMDISYSGYGPHSADGYADVETISIEGTTSVEMKIQVYIYELGSGTVTYSFDSYIPQDNTAPTISDIENQTTATGVATSAIPFTIGDGETEGNLTVSATSSNTTLVPNDNANIVFGGSGTNRTITITPASGQSGTSTITVTVSDGEMTASDQFILTVGTPDTTKPVITLVGDSTVRIAVGNTYSDAGATAEDDVDGTITGSILVTNPVDTNEPGTYTVTYNVSDASGNAADAVTRTVTVAPAAVTVAGSVGIAKTIAVSGATAGATLKLYNSSNAQVGTNATADGSGAYTFTNVAYGTGYYVKQTVNGVESDASATANVTNDTTKPVITLNGGSTVRIVVGNTYLDAGAMAVDNLDGDRTSAINVTNPVDTTIPGIYTICYNVSDLSGNAADEITRIVTVAPAAVTVNGGTQTVSIENAIPGAILDLYNASHASISNGTADAQGKYTFTNVQGGAGYYVIQTKNGVASDPSNSVSVSNPYTPVALPNNSSDDGVPVIVNGVVQESVATQKVSRVDNKSVTTIVVDENKLNAVLEKVDPGYVVIIPVSSDSDIVEGTLNGQLVSNMEKNQAVVQIRTDLASYTLPANQINVNSLAQQFGPNTNLGDIEISIKISEPEPSTQQRVNDAASSNGLTLVGPPVEFNVEGTYGGKTIEISKFNAYVERTIAIPDEIDPNRITTGTVVEADGTVRHVPTKVESKDGKYYATINSLTNSTYAVVWHPVEFADVENHWSKNAANDMGSRMVISGTEEGKFNPDQDITRAEFAAIVVRALGLKLDYRASSFNDVSASDWYNSAVNTANAYGLIDGFKDGTFRPNDKITREQAMVITARAMTISGLKEKLAASSAEQILSPYEDAAAASNWAKSGIADCVQSGVVTGASATRLAPQANITRAEVAVIAQKLLQKSDLI